MTKFLLSTAAAALAIAAVLPSQASAASLLAGKTIQLRYIFPDAASTFEGPVNYTVGTSPDAVFFGLVNVKVTDTQIFFSVPGFTGNFSGAAFNGLRLTDASNTVASFTSATLSPSSTFGGFTQSRISFDANNVNLNFQGLAIAPDGVAVVDLAGGVPEPAAWALMLAGFGLVGGAMRRRQQTVRVTYA